MKSSPLESAHKPLPRHEARARHDGRKSFRTDCHFQAAANAVASSRHHTGRVGRSQLRDFRSISSDFMAAETHREFAAEAALFALVTAIVSWPIISMLIALAQTARG